MANNTPTHPTCEVHVDPKFQQALDQVRQALPEDKRAGFNDAIAAEKKSICEYGYGGPLARELMSDFNMHRDKIAPSLPQLTSNDRKRTVTLINDLHNIGIDVSQKADAAGSGKNTKSMTPKQAEEAENNRLEIQADLESFRNTWRNINDAITKASEQAITVVSPPPAATAPHSKPSPHR